MRGIVVAMLVLLSALPASAASLEERLAPCLACHGEKGQSEIPEVPSLGAQPAFYVTIQLFMFREKLRLVELMNEMTKGLNDDELRRMADFVSKLPPPQPVGAGGEQPHCTGITAVRPVLTNVRLAYAEALRHAPREVLHKHLGILNDAP